LPSPDVTVNIDASGDADNPGVAPDQTIQWQLDTGVAGPFAVDLPNSMFHDNPGCVTLDTNNPTSEIYTVKHGAAAGNHSYTIAAGDCATRVKGAATGAQTITVDTSVGHQRAAYK
jgi:hypothetical protein